MKDGVMLRIVNTTKSREQFPFLWLHSSDFVAGVHTLWEDPVPSAGGSDVPDGPAAMPPATDPALEAAQILDGLGVTIVPPKGNDISAYDPGTITDAPKRSHRKK